MPLELIKLKKYEYIMYINMYLIAETTAGLIGNRKELSAFPLY